jgi:hypothetical protein
LRWRGGVTPAAVYSSTGAGEPSRQRGRGRRMRGGVVLVALGGGAVATAGNCPDPQPLPRASPALPSLMSARWPRREAARCAKNDRLKQDFSQSVTDEVYSYKRSTRSARPWHGPCEGVRAEGLPQPHLNNNVALPWVGGALERGNAKIKGLKTHAVRGRGGSARGRNACCARRSHLVSIRGGRRLLRGGGGIRHPGTL